MRTRTTASLLLAGLFAAGSAFAQYQVEPMPKTVGGARDITLVPAHVPSAAWTMSDTWDIPVRGGEVTTMTNGVPNMSTNNHTPDGVMAPEIHLPPLQVSRMASGEISTYVGGQPNGDPDDPRLKR